jgi:hypothetical protein
MFRLFRLVAPAWQHGSAVAPRLGPADVLHLGQRPMGHARALLHHLSGLCGFGFLAAHVCVVMLGQKRCALGRNYSDSIYLSIHPSIYLSVCARVIVVCVCFHKHPPGTGRCISKILYVVRHQIEPIRVLNISAFLKRAASTSYSCWYERRQFFGIKIGTPLP